MRNLKIVNLSVVSRSVPALIEVYSSNGLLLKRQRVFQMVTNFCLRTCSHQLRVVLSYGEIRQTKYVRLSCCPCEKVVVGFPLIENIQPTPPEVVQNFILTDEFYSLPIAKAQLRFTQNS